MFKRSFIPEYLLVQGSAYPLLNLSAYSERAWPHQYHKLDLSDDPNSNILRILSSEETAPYAISVFLGNIQGFWQFDAEGNPQQTGSAIMGFVFSYAHLSVYQNEYIPDQWLEIKWKLKGNKDTHSWNVQGGWVFHHLGASTPGPLEHALVGSIDRRWMDRNRGISLLYNSWVHAGFEAPVLSKRIQNWEDYLSNFLFEVGLAYPLKKKIVIWLIGGFRYTNILDMANTPVRDLQYIIKPNIDF
jgi:hypothetical protein